MTDIKRDVWCSAIEPVLDSPSDLLAQRLSRSLAVLGWRCLQADIDVDAHAARVELKRDDGRIVTLDIDRRGRASITREHHGQTTVTIGRRGDRCLVERSTVRFLGRSRFTDAREAVNALVAYVSDNSTGRGAFLLCFKGFPTIDVDPSKK